MNQGASVEPGVWSKEQGWIAGELPQDIAK